MPFAIKQWGYPHWYACGNVGNKFGLLDPPYAIPPATGLPDPGAGETTTPARPPGGGPTGAGLATPGSTASQDPTPTNVIVIPT